jgi:hypothetical protein
MGKSAPSAPAAPSPQAVTQANDQSALYNASLANVNQVSPLGNETFTLTQGQPTLNTQAYNQAYAQYQQQLQNQSKSGKGGTSGGNSTLKPPDPSQFMTNPSSTPQYTETTSFNPQVQSLINTTEGNMNQLATTAGGLMGQIQAQAANPINYSGFAPVPAAGDLSNMQNTSFNAQMNQLQPLFQQQDESENSQLLNQGITPGSQAWNNAWYTVNAGQNNAAQQALENAQNYAAGMDQTALANRNQQIAEAYQQQNAPINQYSALMGQTQVQQPNFPTAPSSMDNAASTPPAGNTLEQNYAQQLQSYNAQVAQQNSEMNGLFGLGGTALTAIMQ